MEQDSGIPVPPAPQKRRYTHFIRPIPERLLGTRNRYGILDMDLGERKFFEGMKSIAELKGVLQAPRWRGWSFKTERTKEGLWLIRVR